MMGSLTGPQSAFLWAFGCCVYTCFFVCLFFKLNYFLVFYKDQLYLNIATPSIDNTSFTTVGYCFLESGLVQNSVRKILLAYAKITVSLKFYQLPFP